MADERLIAGLSAWLRDSDVPPPEARMSASRVMAGLEVTPQLGRLWPPARFTSAVEPAPALGAFGPAGPPPRPVPRVQKPKLKSRLRSTLMSVRFLAVANVVALSMSVLLIGASMLPSGSSPRSAALLPAASAPASSPGASPSVIPVPTPTPAPTPIPAPTWAPSDRALDWQTDSVRLEAKAVSLAVADKAFVAPPTVEVVGSSGAETGSIDGDWVEEGIAQRLIIEVASDGDTWWVDRIRTYDGRRKSGWLEFGNLAAKTTTPVGQTWEGDLRAKSTDAQRKVYRKRGSGVLTLQDLRLSAFGPVGLAALTSPGAPIER